MFVCTKVEHFFGTTQFRINGTSLLNIIILLLGKARCNAGGGGA